MIERKTILTTKQLLIESTKQQWIDYISDYGNDRNPESETNKHRLALTEKMFQLEQDNRKLFHLTVTYKAYKDRTYNKKDVDTFFINFYTKNFLPYLLGTRNIHTVTKKSIQPITYAFIDEHEHSAKAKSIRNSFNEFEKVYEFPIRLHHHAILAVHKDTLPLMQSLIGENTIPTNKFSSILMTTDLKECEAQRLLYASKMLKTYPDFLSFPDRLVRQHFH